MNTTGLTITYYTSRKLPMFSWFFDSLWKQLLEPRATQLWPRIVVVDFFHSERPHALHEFKHRGDNMLEILHVPAKPCVWQGMHRLTNEDYFAMANARNTGLCFAKDGWIVFTDDLSVLRPGWLDGVYRAINHGHAITVGAYRKVRELNVTDGEIISCIEDPKAGVDSRYARAGKDEPVRCGGEWLFGYSVGPVEAWLSINGWDQRADGLGFEDVPTGIQLAKKGWGLLYDRTMMVYESEELHDQPGPSFRKADYGRPPNDKSHALLKLAQESQDGWVPNDFGGKTLRELRDEILSGAQFPIPRTPNREWFSGVNLCDIRYAEYPDSLYR